MLITMTEKELTRLRIIQELCDRKIRQIDAVNILNLKNGNLKVFDFLSSH